MEHWSDEFITIQAAYSSVKPSSIAHCPSEAESLGHLAGEEVSRHPDRGAQSQVHETDSDFMCPVCFHHHEADASHLD